MALWPFEQLIEVIDGRRALRTTLSGRRVVKIVLPRAIRTSDDVVVLDVPDYAIGAIMTITVFGITGSFAEGQGVQLDSGLYASHTRARAQTAFSTGIGRHMIIFYPGARMGDNVVNPADNTLLVVRGVPLTENTFFRINVRGTFADGEGIDCFGQVVWLS